MKKLILILALFFVCLLQAQKPKVEYQRWKKVTTVEKLAIDVSDASVVYEVYDTDLERKEIYDSEVGSWQPYSGSGTDENAIHTNEAAEINAITEKVTPVSGDQLIIEDSENGFVKRRVAIGNLPFLTTSDLSGYGLLSGNQTWTGTNVFSNNINLQNNWITNIAKAQSIGNLEFESSGFMTFLNTNDFRVMLDKNNVFEDKEFYISHDNLGVLGKLFRVRENGHVEVPETTIDDINTVGSKSLITREWVLDQNYGSYEGFTETGSEAEEDLLNIMGAVDGSNNPIGPVVVTSLSDSIVAVKAKQFNILNYVTGLIDLKLEEDGALTLVKYDNTSTISGTANKLAAFDADGKVIPIDLPSGGGSQNINEVLNEGEIAANKDMQLNYNDGLGNEGRIRLNTEQTQPNWASPFIEIWGDDEGVTNEYVRLWKDRIEFRDSITPANNKDINWKEIQTGSPNAENVIVSPAVNGNTNAQDVLEDHETRIDNLEVGGMAQSSTITTSRNALLTDADGINIVDSNSEVTITIPAQSSVAWADGTILVYQLDKDATGFINIAYAGGVTGETGRTYSYSRTIKIWRVAEDEWVLIDPPVVDRESFIISASDLTTDITTGDGKAFTYVPFQFYIESVHVVMDDPGTSTGITIDVESNGTGIFDTLLTTDATEATSYTATTAAVLDSAEQLLEIADKLVVNFDAVPTGATGVQVIISGFRW